jgi:6-phosphofructokinase 2
LETAVTYGVAAGTAAVMTPGTELCKKEDVNILFEKLKNPKNRSD